MGQKWIRLVKENNFACSSWSGGYFKTRLKITATDEQIAKAVEDLIAEVSNEPLAMVA